MFGGKGGLGGLMKQAQQMQEEAALEELYAKWEELSLQKDC